MLEPGDAIDLVVSMRHGGAVKLLQVMQDVKILATGTQVHTDGVTAKGKEFDSAARSFTTVTLDATPEDARRIMAAREIGKVTALLRAPGDTARSTVRVEEALALVGLGKPSGGRGPVQVLYGGRSARQPVRPLPETPSARGAPVSSRRCLAHRRIKSSAVADGRIIGSVFRMQGLRPPAGRCRVCGLGLSLPGGSCAGRADGGDATRFCSCAARARRALRRESRVLSGLKATRVAVGAERLLNATVLDNDQLLLFADGAGQTSMQMWLKGGDIVEYIVTVRPVDMENLQAELRALLLRSLDTDHHEGRGQGRARWPQPQRRAACQGP